MGRLVVVWEVEDRRVLSCGGVGMAWGVRYIVRIAKGGWGVECGGEEWCVDGEVEVK